MKSQNLRALLAAVSLGAFASGCTYQVNTTDDAVDASPGDNKCLDSRGRCTLRAAIMEANASSNNQRIEVPAGTYLLNLPVSSGGGTLVIDSGVTIRGASAASTIIDAAAISYTGQPGGCPEAGTDKTVFRINGGTVSLSYLTIQNGYAQNGGGVFVSDGTVEITDAIIRRNGAFTGGGGLLNDKGVVRIRRSSIIENCATGAFGGGIRNQPTGQVWVYESLIAGNRSNRAGGVRNDGILNLRSTTVTGNAAESPSAGTGGVSQGGFAFLNNVTMTNNSGRGNAVGSFLGGGIHTLSGRTTVVKNSIIARNNGLGGPDDCAGTLTSDSRFNLIGNTTGCTLPADTSSYVLNRNPELGPLASNGGPTQTHRLLFASPALEAAYQFPMPAADGCEPYDQRGVPRPQGKGRCDMGAFEDANAPVFVSRFVLVNADTNADIMTVRNGELLNLSALPPNLNIRVELTSGTASVVFGLDANPTYKIENTAPFALGGDDPAGDFLPIAIPTGTHTLRATPFSGAAGTGAAGGSLEVRFTVY